MHGKKPSPRAGNEPGPKGAFCKHAWSPRAPHANAWIFLGRGASLGLFLSWPAHWPLPGGMLLGGRQIHLVEKTVVTTVP
jgi:hypothetical protein